MQITAVIVLYKEKLAECPTYKSLAKISRQIDICRVLVYDNSPQAQDPPSQDLPLSYYHDPENGGLVPAYNKAATMAQEHNSDWLLLLDQDSDLTVDFAVKINEAIEESDSKTAFICPRIFTAGKQVSPVRVWRGLARGRSQQHKSGVCRNEIMAINSACLIKVPFLRKIGFFPNSYSLDYVDHWFCREVYRHGHHGFLMNTDVKHRLSISDMEGNVSHERYESIVTAEQFFYKNGAGNFTKILYLLVLFRRWLSFSIKFKDKRYAGITWQKLLDYFVSKT